MKDWLVSYIKDNFNDLMRADLKLARVLGAPQGHTLSGHAYVLEQQGKPWGRFWRPIIDWLFYWLWDQIEHCKKAHVEDLTRAKLL